MNIYLFSCPRFKSQDIKCTFMGVDFFFNGLPELLQTILLLFCSKLGSMMVSHLMPMTLYNMRVLGSLGQWGGTYCEESVDRKHNTLY